MADHEKFNASSAAQWLNCPGWARIVATVPAEPDSPDAASGTRCHQAMADWALERPRSVELDEEEAGLVERACELVKPFFANAIGRLVESKSMLGDHCGGTADLVLRYAPDGLAVIDYKFGRREVSAEDNLQLLTYAAATIGPVCDQALVTLAVIQPRASEGISKWVTTAGRVREHAERVKDALRAAKRKNAAAKSGDWCRWCKARKVCTANAERALKVDPGPNPPAPETMTVDAISKVLDGLDILLPWAEEVKAYAQRLAETGTAVPGRKLVRGRTLRRWKDEAKAAEVLTQALGDEAYEPRELVSPAKAEKKVGKGLIEELTIKPEGKLTLVPMSDKRDAVTDDAAEFQAAKLLE